jgi:hypothetical protein
MATLVCTGNYREDLATAKKLGIIKGNPKKDVLYNAIQQYEIENDNISEGQKISEIGLVDELINACNDSTEKGDLPLLPKPVLKRDRVQKPKPVLKSDCITIEPDPLKRPTPKPIKRVDRVVGHKPKLNNKFNRSLFQ